MLATRRHIGAMTRPWWAADSSALQSRSSSIRNSYGQGAVAGTPGTIPTNWIVFPLAGLTQTIVGVGVESGIDYLDFKVSGSTTGTSINIYFDSTSGIAAANGQVWTNSVFLKLVGGSFTNVTAVALACNMRDAAVSSLGTVASSSFISSITSVLTRSPPGTVTLNQATTAFQVPILTFTLTNGVAVDFTLRIGWPQSELNSVSTSPIRTSSVGRSGVHSSVIGRA